MVKVTDRDQGPKDMDRSLRKLSWRISLTREISLDGPARIFSNNTTSRTKLGKRQTRISNLFQQRHVIICSHIGYHIVKAFIATLAIPTASQSGYFCEQ